MKKIKVEMGDYILLVLLFQLIAYIVLLRYSHSDLSLIFQTLQTLLYFFNIIPFGFVFFTMVTAIVYLFWIFITKKSLLKIIFPILMILVAGIWLNELLKY
jgi:hypothetical protein